MKEKGLILVIDDDFEMTETIREVLENEQKTVQCFSSASEAWEALNSESQGLRHRCQLVITDLRMPGMNGLQFVESMTQFFPQIPVILMTAFGGLETAIEATKIGAFHYLTKPFKLHDFQILVDRALSLRELKIQNLILRGEYEAKSFFHGMVGKSLVMKNLFALVRQVASSQANVLIHGESGTGKELLARALHDLSPRKGQPFVAINVTAIPEGLIESELFGHEKGAFTGASCSKIGLFEQAHQGTLFLDEIGDLSPPLQAKLLRVLQDRKIRPVGSLQEKLVDVRVVAATHKDLKKAISQEQFREDLYYRLAVIVLQAPPLRHRPEDIPLLVFHFVEKFAAQNGKHIEGLTPEALAQIQGLDLPGNVRELENIIERAVVLCQGQKIEVSHLPTLLESTAETLFGDASRRLPTLEDFEKRYIQFVLEKTGGHKEKAAQILGVHRRTLLRKEKEWGWGEEGLSSRASLDRDKLSTSEARP